MLFRHREQLSPPSATASGGDQTMKLRGRFVAGCLLLDGVSVSSVPRQQKDYLSPRWRADKIRDAETTNDRVKLFLTFADDRLKKFQYELEHPSGNRHVDMLNSLLNAYGGCVDDAADLIQLGIERQENIRAGIDLMASQSKSFLAVLEKLSAAGGPDLEAYKSNLDDAIEGTRDAMNEGAKKLRRKLLHHRCAEELAAGRVLSLAREAAFYEDILKYRSSPGAVRCFSGCLRGLVVVGGRRVFAWNFIPTPAWC